MRPLLLSLALALLPLPAAAQLGLRGVELLSPAAQAAHAQSTAHSERAEWDKARPLLETVLAEALATLGPAHGTTVELGLSYGHLLSTLDRDAEALAHFERLYAEVRRNFTELSPYYAAAEVAYAGQLSAMGRHAEALPLALATTRRVGGMIGDETATTAIFLRDAATILRRMGYLEEALEAYRRVVPIFDAEATPAAARLAAQTLFLQSDVLERLRRYDEAYAVQTEADARAAAAFGPGHPETLAIRLARARLAQSLGDHAALARILDDNLPRVVDLFGEGSLQHGLWLVLQAWREADAAQDAAAGLPTMAHAVAIVAAVLPDTHRVTGETRAAHASMLYNAGRYDEAWAEYERAEPAVGHDRKFLLDVLSFRRDTGALDEGALAAAALPHLQRVAGGAARGAVREQVLRSLIRDPEAGRLYREATDLAEERRRVEAAIAEVAARPVTQADPAREAALRERLAGLAEGIRTRMTEVQRREPAFADLTGAVDLDIAGIQALLGPDDAVVLIDHQRHDEEWSVAVAITQDRAVARLFWVPVADLTGWIRAVRDSVNLTLGVRAAVALDDSAPEAPGAFPAEAAVALYDASLGQVTDIIAPVDAPFKAHLFVEFRGPMTGLPPALLMPYPPDPGTAPQDLPFLLRWHAFTMLPALTALRSADLARARPRAPEAFAGFADPVYDAAEARALLLASAAEGSAETRLRSALVPLPETAGEARAVRASVAAGEGPLWLGADATEAQLKAADLSRYRMLYFATHGLVSGDRAGRAILAEPALALTPGQGEDGFLTATEIAQLRLNADWVVLSACNTAQGAEPGAEALSGLAQAFLYAGARALLVSHWPVESRSAVALMTNTFRLRAERPDEPSAFALRQAMNDMLRAPPDPRWSHPAYWAPFVLVGSPD